MPPGIVRQLSLISLLGVLFFGCARPDASVPPKESREMAVSSEGMVPEWSKDVVWYQVFPERFRNGDPDNDPTRASLEFPDIIPDSWKPTPWITEWYRRAPWERQMGGDFYEDGVFHRRLGGDLRGIIDQLNYLENLGITGIYFNPVFYARSLHKYDGNSFHHVDPYFGPDPEADLALMATETADPDTWHWTEADRLFLHLIEEAHRRGIRVVIDGVFNHTGRGFFAFENLIRNQQDSPYRDWYIIQSFDDPATAADEFAYKAWWGVETLPEFANSESGENLHPGPKEYILEATRRWMDPDGDGDPVDGIDGWRLDVAEEVPIGFWTEWNRTIRQINPEVYTVTEIWNDASAFLEQGGFSATMNYYGFALPVKGFLIDGLIPPSEFAGLLVDRQAVYLDKHRFSHQNIIESHDTDRLASMIVNRATAYRNPDRFDYDEFGTVSPRHSDLYLVRAPNNAEKARLRLVALFQYTFVGAPVLYFGTEAGMWGADDPDDRKPMIWPDLTYEPETLDPRGFSRPVDSVAFDHDLFAFYRTLSALRHDHISLRRGDFSVADADDAAGVFSFLRSIAEETLWIVLNPGERKANVAVPDRREVRSILFLVNGEASVSPGTDREIILPAGSGAVVELGP